MTHQAIHVQPSAQQARPLPDELEILLLFRSMTTPQQKAFLRLVNATVAFNRAMEGVQ